MPSGSIGATMLYHFRNVFAGMAYFSNTDPSLDPDNGVLPWKLWVETDDDDLTDPATAPTGVISVRNGDNSAWVPIPFAVVGSTPPTGPAGGDLDGMYPDPDVKASVALTGVPTAPTAAPGTNTTQIATMAALQAAITALIGTAPGVLDTLGEISDAINDDANLYATIVTALALKAPIASPTLTGTPAGPTAAPGTNTTQLATTAFVVAAVSAIVAGVSSFNSRTGAVVPAAGDYVIADITGLAAALALLAPLASPALTGTPTAPTAAPGTNTTQLATTAFVAAAVAAVVAGVSSFNSRTGAVVPAAGDYATADITGLAAALALLAPLASPALTGNPTVPTQTAGTNNTRAASTAYADNAVAKQPEVLIIAVSDETTAITTGTAKVTFRMPFAMTLTGVRGSLSTASSSGIPTVNIKEGGTTIFSTKLTIDSGAKTSVGAATPSVLSDTSLADDAEMTVDIDVAGTGAKGLKIYLIGTRT